VFQGFDRPIDRVPLAYEFGEEVAALRCEMNAVLPAIAQGMMLDQSIPCHEGNRLAYRPLRQIAARHDLGDCFRASGEGAHDGRVAGAIIEAERAIAILAALLDEFPDIAQQFSEAGSCLLVHMPSITLALLQLQEGRFAWPDIETSSILFARVGGSIFQTSPHVRRPCGTARSAKSIRAGCVLGRYGIRNVCRCGPGSGTATQRTRYRCVAPQANRR